MNRIDNNIYEGFVPWPQLDVYGWGGDAAIFDELIEEVKPSSIVEVGTWRGQSALHMADACERRKLNCQITCVDTWLGADEFWEPHFAKQTHDLKLKHGYPTVYYQFLSNVIHRGHQSRILPLPMPSTQAARLFKVWNRSADLVYIDAGHVEEEIAADLRAWWPLCRKVLFGHDYDPNGFPGVPAAVNKFAQEMNFPFSTHGNFWVMKK